ncbi:MAG: peptide chain release factor N(5)-glutamine methyltransferase [Negativicutes bacterium]|nr:peptide chain release factor N(5)-glutamine methyltransferase [Negativicutes bacterium]
MADIWTIGAILKWTGQYFSEKGVESPRLDAEVLLSHILGRDRLYLYTHFDQPLNPDELAAFRECVKKRVMRQPVAYITGKKEFMGLEFTVNSAVLIPRPDTEILVEQAEARLRGIESPQIADLGTGSGAIIVSLLCRLAGASGVAVDISPAALAVARANAVRHGVDTRLELTAGDLFAPLTGKLFDAILSNPPYIPAADIAGLAAEVRAEPQLALDGGPDGLNFYRRLMAAAPQFLKPGGFIAVEVGAGQAEAVSGLALEAGLVPDGIIRDYGGVARVVTAARR